MRLGDDTPPYQLQSESKNVNMHMGRVYVNIGSKVETPNTSIFSPISLKLKVISQAYNNKLI